MVEMKMKNLEIISTQATIGYLVASEDASENNDHEKSFSLISILKNTLDIFGVLSKDHNTVNKKWNQLVQSKAKFTLGHVDESLSLAKYAPGDKKVFVSESISFLQKIQSLEDILCDLSIQSNILVHLGNLSEKLSQGNQIFIQKNFTAQRIKKLAFGQQASRNVGLSK